MAEMKVKYRALSYVWGDSAKRHPIKVNGQNFEVTSNLLYFLTHRNQLLQTKKFWIDALCINQIDDEEKSHQIPRMRERYMRMLLECIASLALLQPKKRKQLEP